MVRGGHGAGLGVRRARARSASCGGRAGAGLGARDTARLGQGQVGCGSVGAGLGDPQAQCGQLGGTGGWTRPQVEHGCAVQHVGAGRATELSGQHARPSSPCPWRFHCNPPRRTRGATQLQPHPAQLQWQFHSSFPLLHHAAKPRPHRCPHLGHGRPCERDHRHILHVRLLGGRLVVVLACVGWLVARQRCKVTGGRQRSWGGSAEGGWR